MAGHKVVVGSQSFNSKKEASRFFSEMLGRYRDGEEVSESDSSLLIGALKRRPDSQQKIGVGVKRFFRVPNGPTSCFWIEHNDGSTIDFSFKKMLWEKRSTEKREVIRRTARAVLEETITANCCRSAICFYSGAPRGAEIDRYFHKGSYKPWDKVVCPLLSRT
jgi:hypothetical protein